MSRERTGRVFGFSAIEDAPWVSRAWYYDAMARSELHTWRVVIVGEDGRQYHTFVVAPGVRAARKVVREAPPPRSGLREIVSVERVAKPRYRLGEPRSSPRLPRPAPPPPPPPRMTAEEEFEARFMRDRRRRRR